MVYMKLFAVGREFEECYLVCNSKFGSELHTVKLDVLYLFVY